MADLGVRALAFLVFAALLGGSVWAAYEYLAVEGASIDPLGETYDVGAGTAFTVPWTVTNTGSAPAHFFVAFEDDGGLGVGRVAPVEIDVEGFGKVAGWSTFAVRGDAPAGDHRVALAVAGVAGERLAGVPLDVTVLPAGEGLGAGDTAQVRYVGRYPEGPVFDTNVEAIAFGPWPKAQDFRPHPTWEPFPVTLGPDTRVVAGFAQGLEGMRVGQSRTVVVPPELGYGNATREDVIPRTVEIERNRTVDVRDLQIQRPQWESHIRSTGQGDPATFGPGSTFEIYDELNTYRARVVEITPTVVTYRFALQEGDRFTLFPFWPDASEVVSVNDTSTVIRTTPTTEPGERFTYFRPWANVTTLDRVEDDLLVLRHEVEPGYTYMASPDGVAPPTELRVARVTDDEIVVAIPNPAPLAGRTLVFDITVVG